jgi:hypothetical protein
MTIKIYIAQKVEDATVADALTRIMDYETVIEREELDIHITAWYVDRLKEISEAGAGQPEPEEVAFECKGDVKACDVFILDLRGEGAPGGSLVETGMAMALGKPVYILEHPKSRHYSNRAMITGYGNLRGRFTNIRELLGEIQIENLIDKIRRDYFFTYDDTSVTLRTADGTDGVTFRAVGDDATYLAIERAVPEDEIPF